MIICSQNFLQAMGSRFKEVYLKIEFYDHEMKYIGEFTRLLSQDDLGQISVDVTRPVRRSFQFALCNQDGRFTWGEDKLVWIDKRCRILLGLKLPDGTIEYVPQGVFVLTEPADTHDFDGKRTYLTGQDKAYLLTDKRGRFLHETTIAKNVNIGTAIRTIADGGGETLFNFDEVAEVTPFEFTYEHGDNRWRAIKELAELAKSDVFYDVYGYLRLKKIDFNSFENDAVVWIYRNNEPTDIYYAGNIRRFDETNLSNHIIVLGGSGQTASCRYELKVDKTDPLWTGSPYSIQKIGDILYEHNNGSPDSLLATADECKWRAKYELMRRLGFSERVSMQVSPNWLHDGGDIIVIEDQENDVTGKYLLTSFNLPLIPELMNCECLKYRTVITDWNFI